MSDVPKDILDNIHAAAREEWPGDTDMQEFMIGNETAGYLEIQRAEFGPALPHRETILKEAEEYDDAWESRASFVNDEIEAFAALEAISADDIPAEVLPDARQKAAAEADWYSVQLEDLQRRLQQYRYVRDTRAKIEPMRELLTRMEKIVGNACYNGNIQNYAGYGTLDSVGRTFRYPISFPMPDDSVEKRRDRQDDLPPETLINGYYKMGANEMGIYRALIRIIKMLETEYGFKLPVS